MAVVSAACDTTAHALTIVLEVHGKDLLAATGYIRGGCSPVGMKKRFRTLIDETCVLWDTIFISGGKRGYQLELAPDDLVAFCGATVAPITRED